MTEYISRQEAIEYFMANTNWHDEDGCPIHDSDDKRKLLTDYFSGVPSADVVPDITGTWRHYEGMPTCSTCDAEFYPSTWQVCHVKKEGIDFWQVMRRINRELPARNGNVQIFGRLHENRRQAEQLAALLNDAGYSS